MHTSTNSARSNWTPRDWPLQQPNADDAIEHMGWLGREQRPSPSARFDENLSANALVYS